MQIGSKKLFLLIAFCAVFIAVLLILDFVGVIWHNSIPASFYTVKGLDVSHHQGQIDWQKVAESKKYSFVFIKATEGHDFFDDDFAKNWKEAKEHGLLVGAYHFFSVRSSGKEQAELFISTVPKEDDALPPVIDIEISLNQDRAATQKEIQSFADELEKHYRKKPILYVTYDTYNAYVKGNFTEYHIWIRDIVKFPFLKDRTWLMWQYSNRGRVAGISTYVDINVFKGTQEELRSLIRPK